ncbi:MAG: OB-fold domain-containing protein [Alphaproteobacteria bacterium]
MTAEDALPPLLLPPRSPANAPFWDAAAEGRLMLQRRPSTGEVSLDLASPLAPGDEWFEASGRGVVKSFDIVTPETAPDMPRRQRYVAALIDLAEGPCMPANIVGPDALDVAVGDQVRCVFEARGCGVNVPQFVRDKG